MAPSTKLALSILASASLIGTAAWAGHVNEGGWTFTTTLSGAVEIPTGDPNGSGTFTMTVNPGQKRVCYQFTNIANIETPTAAHIHLGAAGTAGPFVIPFPSPPPLGSSAGCADATSRQLAQIIAKPELYYVNVHNATYPLGAIRGQFSRPAH